MQTGALDERVVKLVPGGDGGLAHLSDGELLANTRQLVGRSNQVFAALLAHLAEVESRGLHRTRACASLYTYCIYELRFSEDAAARRAGAAKLVKRFPVLLPAIANGELHLTGLLMLGPHFTPENIVEVLGRAKFRTKKELTKLVRELHPLPLVPDLVEPLRPEPRPLRRPTSEEYAASLAPAVRELPLGERPKDWANDVNDIGAGSVLFEGVVDGCAPELSTLAPVSRESLSPAPARVETPPAPARVEPLWAELPPITGPQQYQVQFSTTEEHVQLIERAKALLARRAPGRSLGELHLEAMRLLVKSLEKRRFATTERGLDLELTDAQCGERPRASVHDLAEETVTSASESVDEGQAATEPSERGRGRHVPAAVRRAIYERDVARCTYVDARGERCQETHHLELHHRRPFGKGGAHTPANLTLHCRAHNALAAELDFGREYMAQRQQSNRHESLASQHRAVSSPIATPDSRARCRDSSAGF
jgi:hypothetical protein